jgi:hypothetical protein
VAVTGTRINVTISCLANAPLMTIQRFSSLSVPFYIEQVAALW